jgi:GNAT superfamily N-acetyltransferase
MKLSNLGRKIAVHGKLLKSLIYSRHEEIILAKDLIDLKDIPYGELDDLRAIRQEDIPRLAEFRKQNKTGGHGPEVYLKNGCSGLMAEIKGEIVGYAWFGNNKTNFNFDPAGYGFYADKIALAPGGMYAFDFFIAPHRRRGGIAVRFATKFQLIVKQWGYNKIFVFVRKTNKPAHLVYHIVGGKDFKRIVVRRFLMYFVFKDASYFYDRYGREWLLKEKGRLTSEHQD